MPQPIVMPGMGMYAEEGVLSAWLRPPGARVEIGEPLLEITTEKVTFEVPSAAAGILHHVLEVGASLRVEQLLGYILAEGETLPAHAEREVPPAPALANAPPRTAGPHNNAPTGAPLRASPAARRLATQHGVDLSCVQGSGPDGRIVEADILAKVSHRGTQHGPASQATKTKED